MWAKLGIALELITPGRPGENGRHERMHRTLKQETLSSGDGVARFADIELGVIDRGSTNFHRFSAPHPARAEPVSNPELSGM